MTPNKAIEYIDGIRPNVYDEEVKLRWIDNVDGMVKKLVFGHKKIVPYAYPDDMDTELLIKEPFDDVYSFYLESMIDYYNREYGNYNNSAAMFESRFSEYKKAVIRGEIDPILVCQHCGKAFEGQADQMYCSSECEEANVNWEWGGIHLGGNSSEVPAADSVDPLS